LTDPPLWVGRMLREPIAWAGLTFMGWLVALPLSAHAGDPDRVWQPEIERIVATEGGPIYNVHGSGNGTRITITGRHLLPVVLDKDASGKEVKLGLASPIRGDAAGVVAFTGRVGGVEVRRQYYLEVGTGYMDFERSAGGPWRWTDTVIEGEIVPWIAPGLHPVSIRGPIRFGAGGSRLSAISNEFPIRVINGDFDADGHFTMADGGDDCDDVDRTRYPGAIEVIDLVMHDEDCDPETLGRDVDGDGFIDMRSCNWRNSSSLHCGDDCEDGDGDIHPHNSEACNDRDDNCDGVIDEELYSCSSPHAGQFVHYEEPQVRNRPAPESAPPVGAAIGAAVEAQSLCKCPPSEKRKK
jgi:hypothetical protein